MRGYKPIGIFAVLMLLVFGSHCQPPQKIGSNYQFKSLGADSGGLRIPAYDTLPPNPSGNYVGPGALAWRKGDSTLWAWDSVGHAWLSLPMRTLETINKDSTQIRNFDTIYSAERVPQKIIQKKVAGFFTAQVPYNYGVVYPSIYAPHGFVRQGLYTSSYASQGSLDPGGMPDNVMQWQGYNVANNFARKDTMDAAYSFRAEGHFINSLHPVQPNFEFHLPEFIDYSGNFHRPLSLYAGKLNGFVYMQSEVNDHKYFNAFRPGDDPYYEIQVGDSSFTIVENVNARSFVTGGQAWLKHISDGAGHETLLSSFGTGDFFVQNNTVSTRPSFGFVGVGGNFYVNQNNNPMESSGQMQVGNTGYGIIDPSAQLEIISTTRGVAFPQLTTAQKTAISSPKEGLQVYDITLHQMSYWNGTIWVNF